MTARLSCFAQGCRSTFPVDQIIYSCPHCGSLLEVSYDAPAHGPALLKQLWLQRRLSSGPLDQSGVWRYRELIDFLPSLDHVVTLREGNTPLLPAPSAARYAALDALFFKHQGFNPTGSFKDNGMTCGVAQARSLGMQRVACVSTGNTSASMAAYAAAGGLQPLIFIPHGSIAFGKLSQALEYGARTFQVQANFDQILKLIRALAEQLGIYLLNSVNPFRIEGQKTIAIELLEQTGWQVPDWVVLPGGNLGNVSAFGKGFRELHAYGFIPRLPRLAVIQAAGAAPFYAYMQARPRGFQPVEHPQTLATAIKIGDPVSWPKAEFEIDASGGLVEQVSEQEIADAKAQIGRCGIGCEPASAATLAGIRKLRTAGRIRADEHVIAVLTGHLLKDPDYIYGYHTETLKGPDGHPLRAPFANKPIVVPPDPQRIAALLAH